jgi:hypothetical protein
MMKPQPLTVQLMVVNIKVTVTIITTIIKVTVQLMVVNIKVTVQLMVVNIKVTVTIILKVTMITALPNVVTTVKKGGVMKTAWTAKMAQIVQVVM